MKIQGPLDWIKEKIAALKILPPEKSKKSSYLLILLVLGALLMLLGSLLKGNPDDPVAIVTNEQIDEKQVDATFSQKNESNESMRVFEEQYETELKEALEEIVGVNGVKVIVNVEATEKNIYEKNSVLRNQTTREEDKEGGVREIEDQSKEDELVIIRDSDKEKALLSETQKPNIKGVLIVAGGAENIQVKKWIIEAVTRVLDVPSHKVAVIPKKSKGES